MRSVVLVLVGLAACDTYDPTWQVRVGVPAQPLARADLAIGDAAAVGPGDAWIAIRSYDSTDVVYPIAQDTSDLYLESPFDPTIDDPHAALVTATRLSRDAEPAEKHPARQYATVFVEAIVAPAVRDAIAAGMPQQLAIELEVPSDGPCAKPAVMVAGSVTGCLSGGSCAAAPLGRRDGLYQAGPLVLSIEVLGEQCAE
jgi:hypothetical protein